MDEEEGIYRDEVRLMLLMLVDIKVAVVRILGYIEGTMKKKRTRKIFRTPEEREECEIRSEAMQRMLRDRIERIEAELRTKDPNYRGLTYWIEQVRAEREAYGNAA